MSTENLEEISNGQGSMVYTWRELEVLRPERRSSERGGQRLLELAEATERYAEESAAVREEAEGRTRASAVYNPSPVVVSLTELCTADDAYSRRLSVSDAVTDRYREMEKRVEEQDRTIAELKGIIENLQDIVYRQKLDKEAETLVL